MQVDALLGFDADPRRMPVLAPRAEALGFGALWSAETQHDPFLPLALVAEHTRRIRLGTAVAVAFARSPTVVAAIAWDLARQSDGRFILGMGTQVRPHIERRFGMAWSGRPVAQLRDYVAAMRAAWTAWQTGERPNHRGEFYRVTLMTPFFDPGPIPHPGIPVFLAGVGTAMCALAGEVADGLIVHPLHSRRYLLEAIRPAVADGAARSGREAQSIALSGSVLVALGEADVARVREQIAFYASTPAYRPVLAVHGWEEVGNRLSDLARHGRWSEMAAQVSDEMVDAFAVVGGWDELPDRLRERYDGLLDRVSLYRPFGDPDEEPRWRRLLGALAG